MTAAELFHARVLGGGRQQVGRRDQPCYAPWLDRGPSLAALADALLPEPRSYTWEYSNPNPWYERNALDPDDEPAEGIVASQGIEVADFDTADPRERGIVEANLNATIDRRRYPLAAVNDILLGRGVVIEIPARARETEIELGSLGGGFERVLLIVGEGAEATLVERPAAPTHRVVECLIRTGGSLRHTRLQGAADSLEYHLVSTRVDAHARYRFAQYAQGRRDAAQRYPRRSGRRWRGHRDSRRLASIESPAPRHADQRASQYWRRNQPTDRAGRGG